MYHKTFWNDFIVSLSLPHCHLELGKRVNRGGGLTWNTSKISFLWVWKSHYVVGTETNTNWRTIKRVRDLLPQRKDNFLLEWFCDIRHFLYRKVTSKGRYQSGHQESVRYTEVSPVMCLLQRFFYESLTIVWSVPKKKVCYKEVPSI